MRHPVVLACFALGIIVRTIQYAAQTSMWLDELAVAHTVVVRDLVRLVTEPLAYRQVAPAGFLALQKIATTVDRRRRGGIPPRPLDRVAAALFVFWRLAERLLTRPAAWTVFAVFAASPALTWFGSQAKQYSTDVVALLLVIWAGCELLTARPRLARAVLAGVFAILVSMPAVLAGGAIGLVLLVAAVRTGIPARNSVLVVGACWTIAALVTAGLSQMAVTTETRDYMSDVLGARLPARTNQPRRAPVDAPRAQRRPRLLAVLRPRGRHADRCRGSAHARGPDRAGRLVAGTPFGLLRRCCDLAGCRRPPRIGAALTADQRTRLPVAGRATAASVRSRLVRRRQPVAVQVAHHPRRGGRRDRRSGDRLRHHPWSATVPFAGYEAGAGAGCRADAAGRFGLRVLRGAAGDALLWSAGWDHPMDGRQLQSPQHPRDLRELDAFRGQKRVWVIWTHAIPRFGEPEAIRSYLSTIGTEHMRIEAPGEAGEVPSGEALLYDLSDPARLASSAAGTHPLPPPQRPNEGPNVPCGGPANDSSVVR